MCKTLCQYGRQARIYKLYNRSDNKHGRRTPFILSLHLEVAVHNVMRVCMHQSRLYAYLYTCLHACLRTCRHMFTHVHARPYTCLCTRTVTRTHERTSARAHKRTEFRMSHFFTYVYVYGHATKCMDIGHNVHVYRDVSCNCKAIRWRKGVGLENVMQ